MIHTDTKEARGRILQRLLKGDASGLELRDDLAARCSKEAVRRAIDWAHGCGYIAPAGFKGRSYRWTLTDAGKAKAAPNQRRLTISIEGEMKHENIRRALDLSFEGITEVASSRRSATEFSRWKHDKATGGFGVIETLRYEYTLEVMP